MMRLSRRGRSTVLFAIVSLVISCAGGSSTRNPVWVDGIGIGHGVYEFRDHFVVETPTATYWLDKKGGGLSRLIDSEGRDWIAYRRRPWDKYPASAAGAYRGLPNLRFGADKQVFGHPGWNRADCKRVAVLVIRCTHDSEEWALEWQFATDHVRLSVETLKPDVPYWFLYEGTIAGRWRPDEQYFATDTLAPIHEPYDFVQGDRLSGQWRWVYFGDRRAAQVLAIVHEQEDDRLDVFAHMGDTRRGLVSEDGMVVFGLGRGVRGIQPLLTGNHSFRIALIEQSGATPSEYRKLTGQVERMFPFVTMERRAEMAEPPRS